MELTLKGKIKKLGTTYGIIESNDYNEEHFFIKSDVLKNDRSKIKIGNTVIFELKTNKNRGSNACKIKLLDDNNITYGNVSKSKTLPNIETVFGNNKIHISYRSFQEFITEGFYILDNKNEDFNDLIKLVVKDNVITDIEKNFLKEKTLELNLSQDLLEKANEYLFSNNPFFDNILQIIYKDGIIKENELAFLVEKSKENSFSPSFVNNRFWQYSFSIHFEKLLNFENIEKIIKLWHLSKNTKFDLGLQRDWIIMQLNILKSFKIHENINRGLEIFENKVFSFIESKYDTSSFEISKLYDLIVLDFNDKNLEITPSIIDKNNDTSISFKVKSAYKKEDIYHMFNVPKEQQKGKWHNGYCEHNNEWFIFTNIGQTGHGFSKENEFDYNNSLDQYGDLNWEAINNSKLSWDSIQKLKSSSPYIFIRKPETKKDYWEYLGKGSCINALDTTPVKFKWKILGDEIKESNISLSSSAKKVVSTENHTAKKRSGKKNSEKVLKRRAHRLKKNELEKVEYLNRNIKEIYKELYVNNPFEAFSQFKKYAQNILKIKQNHKIKKIWNEEIITND